MLDFVQSYDTVFPMGSSESVKQILVEIKHTQTQWQTDQLAVIGQVLVDLFANLDEGISSFLCLLMVECFLWHPMA